MKNYLLALFKSDIFQNFTSAKYMPRWAIFVLDLFIVVIALFAAGVFSIKIYQSSISASYIELRFLLFIVVQLIFFWLFRTYSGIIRYSSYVDAMKLLLAVFGASFTVLILNYLFLAFYGTQFFHTTTILFYVILAYVMLFMIRLVVKLAYDYLQSSHVEKIPVMIYGTQSAGAAIAKMLKADVGGKYNLVGFIDNNREAISKEMMGLKVYDLDNVTLEKKILPKTKTIIITPLKMDEINPQKDLDIFLDKGMTVLQIPPMEVWSDEMPSVGQLKSLQISDLLNRPTIKLATDSVSVELKDKVILVTGAVGSIGSEIVEQCVGFAPKLIILLDQSESALYEMKLTFREEYPLMNFVFFIGDVRNKTRMKLLMSDYKPDIMFHAAAYKHVPLMEDNPCEAIQVNVMGTKIMADLSVEFEVSRFVMVSTDKAVNPTNVMGASKRIAEIYVQSLFKSLQEEKGNNTTKFITTRFGNVLGSSGSVVPRFKEQIEKGGPVTVTHPDIIRYFMTIPEACMLVLEAGVTGKGGEIFVFDMGEQVKIVNLARKMIQLAGLVPDKDIKIEYSGLRPGEKLYEELLNQKEKTIETSHPKIMIALVREYDFNEVSREIDLLIEKSFLGKNFVVVSQMKKIVPEFISNNSQYEKLDLSTETQLY